MHPKQLWVPTPEEIQKIIELNDTGLSRTQIAQQMGYSYPLIAREMANRGIESKYVAPPQHEKLGQKRVDPKALKPEPEPYISPAKRFKF